MDSIDKIRELIEPIIVENGCYLYDVFYEEDNDIFLRIYIDKEPMLDIDTCALISEKVNFVLDNQANIEDVDYVEVSSPGAERPLKTLEQFKTAVHNYVYVEIGDLEGVYGTLNMMSDNLFEVEYFIKGVKKRLKFEYSEVVFARLAVKF